MAYKKTEKNRRMLAKKRKKSEGRMSWRGFVPTTFVAPPQKDLWVWNWKEGGYNSTNADTREEALAKAHEIGKPGLIFRGLTVDTSTLRKVTSAQLQAIDRSFGPYD